MVWDLRASVKKRVAFIEQLLLAFPSLLQSVLYVHLLAIENFGVFSITISTLVFIQSCHRSVIVLTMIGDSARSNGFSLTDWNSSNFWFSLFLAGIAVLATPFVNIAISPNWGGNALYMISFSIFPALVCEFVRRRMYIENNRLGILLSSTMVAVTNSLATTAMFFTNSNLKEIIISMSIFPWINLLWYCAANKCNPLCLGPFPTSLLRVWRRDMITNLLALLPYSFYNSGTSIVVAFLSGPKAAGVYSAGRLLLAPISLLVSAVDNTDKPRAAVSFRQSGFQGLLQSLQKTSNTLILVTAIYSFSLVVCWICVPSRFATQFQVKGATALGIWLFLGFAIALTQPLETALLILRRPDILLISRVAACIALALALVYLPNVEAGSGAVLGAAAAWIVAGVFSAVALVTAREKE